jgi:tetratricopeptide (TPR) repeat protein
VVYPQDAELLAQEGSLLVDRDELDGARTCYEQLLNSQEPAHFASVPIGLHGYLTRHNLAIVSMRQNRPAEAEALWRAAVEEKPELEAAWIGLEDLFVCEKRWTDLDWLANQLAALSRLKHLAPLATARGQIARGEYRAAQALLRKIAAYAPGQILPRLLLSQALLREGTDLAVAKHVLTEILAIAPGHKEASRNLELVRSQRLVKLL